MKKLTWENVELISEELAQKIKESSFQPDYIIGVTTGGLFPLALLAKELKLNKILTFSAKTSGSDKNKKLHIMYAPNIDLRDKKILLVDEIVEKGITLRKIVEMIKRKYNVSELKTATMGVNKDKCLFYPDYYVFFEQGEWVKFPWEKKEKFGKYTK